jgi:hypothetical protein
MNNQQEEKIMAVEAASAGPCARFWGWVAETLSGCVGGGDTRATVTCSDMCNYMNCFRSCNCCSGGVTVQGGYTVGGDSTSIRDTRTYTELGDSLEDHRSANERVGTKKAAQKVFNQKEGNTSTVV